MSTGSVCECLGTNNFCSYCQPQRTLAHIIAGNEKQAERIKELEEKTSVTCGVGSGNGNLFVHGDYDSIKSVQALVFENERLRLAIGRFKNNETTKNKFDLFEMVE